MMFVQEVMEMMDIFMIILLLALLGCVSILLNWCDYQIKSEQ